MKVVVDINTLPCNNGKDCTECAFYSTVDICEMTTVLRSFPKYEDTRPHGVWIRYTEDGFDYAKCSACQWDSGEAFEYAVDRFPFCPNCGASMSANDRQVTGKLNSEIEKSKSEIVPDYRDGWRLKEGDRNE